MLFKYPIYIVLFLYLIGCSSTLPPREFLTPSINQVKGSLYAKFFGTSTVYITDGNNSVMVDGFFTRQGYFKTLATRMKSNEINVNYALERAGVEDVDILLVSHSHYDHALDSENTALLTGATLMGSNRTIFLSPRAKSKKINIDEVIHLGDFEISFYETPHVRKGSFLQIIEKLILWSTGGLRFKDKAEVYSYFLQHPKGNILIIPSSGFSSDIKLPATVDFVFLSIGLLSKQSTEYIENYWQQAVVETCAKHVIPIHWDNFSKPLKQPITTSPKFIDDISKTLDILKKLATHSNCTNSSVEISFPPAYEAFLIDGKSESRVSK
ncbi:MBL fold metallo-hydrolase [Alteromonas macleodii]|uniref:MBL fold metallo-hydrolase n=1 Tax=Alteromonas macleodii TaxID=28108 RepID=UPI002FDFF217